MTHNKAIELMTILISGSMRDQGQRMSVDAAYDLLVEIIEKADNEISVV